MNLAGIVPGDATDYSECHAVRFSLFPVDIKVCFPLVSFFLTWQM